MKKKKTISKLKKELDTIYSRYIRKKEADFRGNATCISCKKIWAWEKLQCGHFVSRRYSNVRYDERNTKPQCFGCNMFRGGNIANYALELQRLYGMSIVEELAKASRELKSFTCKELEGMIISYKEKFNNL